MTTFVDAVKTQEARTENGMKALKSTSDACVDLFFKIGASRGKDIVPGFVAALVEDQDRAIRIAQWARDVRGGAGERQLFVDILSYLDANEPEIAKAVVRKVPELGRWKDLIQVEYTSNDVKTVAYDLIKNALIADDGLAAKWLPRKGKKAAELRNWFGWTPKFYRKRLVELTRVVETQMCEKDWDNIDFGKVPSLAAARYKGAFYRNTEKFAEYVDALTRGEAKVNAGAVYPYDVIKGLGWGFNPTKIERDFMIAQWDALENFVGDANVLPMIDVSGSMGCNVGGNANLTAMEVAVSLGLYMADKNTGKFKDTFLTFSEKPELVTVKGNIVQKVEQCIKSDWGMNTNLHRAMDRVLSVAQNGNVPQEEMPEMLVIFSDMQFDHCTNFDDSAMEMVRRKFELAGYKVPQIVFWNINAYDNVPVKFNEIGVALVSGFSPVIARTVIAGDPDNFSPQVIMDQAIMVERYDWV